MPATTTAHPPMPRALQVLIATLLLATAAVDARAQQGAGSDKDPTVVIARTVHPRVAYRGIPLEENPVQTEATTFPGTVFHGAMDSMIGELVDGELGQRGSAGIATGDAVQSALDNGLSGLAPGALLGAGSASGGPARGPGASVGGAVSGVGSAVGSATSNIGSLVTNSVMQAVGKAGDGGP